MKTIIENIKRYFYQKENGEPTNDAPADMCGPCWGRSEWDGEYYELKRDKHLRPGSEIYESFISKIVDKHVLTTRKHENKYICITCDKVI